MGQKCRGAAPHPRIATPPPSRPKAAQAAPLSAAPTLTSPATYAFMQAALVSGSAPARARPTCACQRGNGVEHACAAGLHHVLAACSCACSYKLHRGMHTTDRNPQPARQQRLLAASPPCPAHLQQRVVAAAVRGGGQKAVESGHAGAHAPAAAVAVAAGGRMGGQQERGGALASPSSPARALAHVPEAVPVGPTQAKQQAGEAPPGGHLVVYLQRLAHLAAQEGGRQRGK